jgi:uncharacterized protein (TIGR02646 family)
MLRAAPNEDLVFEGSQPTTAPTAPVELTVHRSKARPALVVSTGGSDVPKVLRPSTTPKWQTAPTFLIAPFYGTERTEERAGWHPPFIERIRQCEYPQFMLDTLPRPGSTTDSVLAILRGNKLKALRDLIARENRPPGSTEIKGYDIAAELLWWAQHRKCCYCERIIECLFYDVEHYRPKAGVNHGPAHPLYDGGYWWLAFTWENLLFSCKGCNEGKGKGIQFPLTAGSIPLRREQQPRLGERALLIDPAGECGIRHIEFRLSAVEKKWRPSARDGSVEGDETIRVCRLDRDDLVVLYTVHVNSKVRPKAEAVNDAIGRGDEDAVRRAVRMANVDLLRRGREFVGLSYDALRHFVPHANLAPFGQAFRQPA